MVLCFTVMSVPLTEKSPVSYENLMVPYVIKSFPSFSKRIFHYRAHKDTLHACCLHFFARAHHPMPIDRTVFRAFRKQGSYHPQLFSSTRRREIYGSFC
jgi:hypothetical protein